MYDQKASDFDAKHRQMRGRTETQLEVDMINLRPTLHIHMHTLITTETSIYHDTVRFKTTFNLIMPALSH